MTLTVRTLTRIDRDLDTQRWMLEQALERMSVTAAERAWQRIDQLLDERLAVTGSTP